MKGTIGRRRLKDRCNGMMKRPLRMGDMDWVPGGVSRTGLVFRAVMRSDATYSTEDDGHAGFEGHTEVSPDFGSVEELVGWLGERRLGIGSDIWRAVPVNDWEHRPYRRMVACPITSIRIVAEWSADFHESMAVAELTAEGSVRSPEVPGGGDVAGAVERRLRRGFVRTLWSSFSARRDGDGNTVTACLGDLAELERILVPEDGGRGAE
jgi:hypothetical protein